MYRHTLVTENTQARQQFAHDCHLINDRIIDLRDSNKRLSNKLEALIDKQTRLLNRMYSLVIR